MALGNILVIVILSYYIRYIIILLTNREMRINMSKLNNRLEILRAKKIKTQEEQMEFVNLKYPKSGKFKFTWQTLLSIIYSTILFFVILYIFEWLKIDLNLGWGITLFILLPIIINYLLAKFNLQKSDEAILLR